MLPSLYSVDLNKIDNVCKMLEKILMKTYDGNNEKWHDIFLFEVVMMSLDDGVSSSLLQVCQQVLASTEQTRSLCFADKLDKKYTWRWQRICKPGID